MRWKGLRESQNVEDRRGMSPKGAMVGGGLGVVVIALIVMALGGDPSKLLGGIEQTGQPQQPYQETPEEKERVEFVSRVLGDTEDTWTSIFEQSGKRYELPKLILFSGQVQSACGMAGAAMGPFYCPPDKSVYIDLTFYDELREKFGAPGDFAQAYVIAHEVGHHVQNLLGITDRVHSQNGKVSQAEYNRLSVRLELQADFLAGVWAHHSQQRHNLLDRKDVDDALRAATAIGDDTLQRQSQGRVVPDAFTHGTSEQRRKWFMKGFESGRLQDGDTFSVPYNRL